MTTPSGWSISASGSFSPAWITQPLANGSGCSLLSRFLFRCTSGASRPPQVPLDLGARHVCPGLVYVPINQAAWGIFIYIAASIPEVAESTNAVIGLLLVQCAADRRRKLVAPHLSPGCGRMGIGFTLLVGMNRLRMKQKGTADAKLRMAHEEIEQLAKTAERERIARDMHDVLGHSLSLIVLKSELAGRLLESQPARAALEIAEIETPRGKPWLRCAKQSPAIAPKASPPS